MEGRRCHAANMVMTARGGPSNSKSMLILFFSQNISKYREYLTSRKNQVYEVYMGLMNHYFD